MIQPKVIFEDNHLLVVEKPVNLPVQADASGDPDLLSLMKEYLRVKYAKPGQAYLGLVHRLDRPVGGVMVLAKTSKAAARLSLQVRERKLEKVYLAIVHGSPERARGRLRDYLLKDQVRNQVAVVSSQTTGAQEAILDYEVLEQRESWSLVRIVLLTGRPHQIRVQLAQAGHPLYGDQKYGVGLNKPGMQLALWANHLAFEHPTKHERCEFRSAPPVVVPWTLFEKIKI